jgi:hypothetical protein
MKTKMQQWGATLVVFGAASLVLPLIGVQLRVFNLFGENQRAASIAAIILGGVLWLVGMGAKAVSGGTSAPTPAAAPPPIPVSPSATGVPLTAAKCPKCSSDVAPEDRFCLSCGHPLAVAAPPPVPIAGTPSIAAPAARPKHRLRGGCLIMLLLLGAGLAWFFFGGAVSYKLPSRSEPAVPSHVAGTLTEFPIDPEANKPLEPTSITSQTFEPGTTTTQTVQAPAETIPPGLSTSTIPQVATAMTTCTYRSPETNTAPVHVHVLQAGTNVSRAPQIAQAIAQSSGGTASGVQLKSAKGQTYDGYSVRSTQMLIYVLVNRLTASIIILYSPDPRGFPAVQRLASSVGNGQGLREFPKVADTYAALPASVPAGMRLKELRGFTGGELRGVLAQTEAQLGKEAAAAMNQVLESIRLLIPERGTSALYTDARGQERGVLIGNYGSGRRAAVAWRMLNWTIGWGMKRRSDVPFPAMTMGDSNARVMLFHKGPYLGLVQVPGQASEQELIALASSVQL